jgi:superfamily II DNA or RNA helicase
LTPADECHHVSASNFNRILSSAHSKFVYGLSATPIRKDGQHPIIFMQCGPIRFKVDAKKEALKRTFDHYIIPRFTSFRIPLYQNESEWHISDVYKHLCENKSRNNLIVKDIEGAVLAGRNPIVLTERTTHIDLLLEMMKDKDFEVIELSGRMSSKERKASMEKIKNHKNTDTFVIVATGKLIGEGFDEARQDTLFMAMPISWKGTIAQYAGRLHRNYIGKEEVQIYDYIDVHIGVLERMYQKRLNEYRAVGYNIKSNNKDNSTGEVIYSSTDYFSQIIKDIGESKKMIIISSPHIQKNKVELVKELLTAKYHSGLRIVVLTKRLEEYPEKQRDFINQFIKEYEEIGINVIQQERHSHKFMIIDHELIWYGGVDILGENRNEESIIRIINEELGNELIGIIENRGMPNKEN